MCVCVPITETAQSHEAPVATSTLSTQTLASKTTLTLKGLGSLETWMILRLGREYTGEFGASVGHTVRTCSPHPTMMGVRQLGGLQWQKLGQVDTKTQWGCIIAQSTI